MKTLLSSKRSFLYLFIILALGLLIVASICDLNISQTVYSKNNPVCLIFASFGALPAYGGLSFLCGALVSYAFKYAKQSWHKVIAIIISAIGVAAGVYFQGKDFVSADALGYFSANLGKLFILFGVILVLPFFIPGFILTKKNSNQKTLSVIITGICIIVIPCLLSFGIKLIDHRPRFSFLMENGDMSLFRNWWQSLDNYKDYITGSVTSDAFKSFPSMHTSCAFMVIVIAYYLPYFLPTLKEKRKIISIISVIWPIGIAITRVIGGAHFLSDVSFSFLLANIVMLVGDLILGKIDNGKKLKEIPSKN